MTHEARHEVTRDGVRGAMSAVSECRCQVDHQEVDASSMPLINYRYTLRATPCDGACSHPTHRQQWWRSFMIHRPNPRWVPNGMQAVLVSGPPDQWRCACHPSSFDSSMRPTRLAGALQESRAAVVMVLANYKSADYTSD